MAERKTLPSTAEGRVRLVREIFSSITPRYDFLNRLLSFRRDVAWRRAAVRRMRFFKTFRFLDVATGTADLAVEAALRRPEIKVTGVDFVPEMVALGREKVRRLGLSGRVELAEGDALALPFPGGSFDVAAIAFGIRNIPDRGGALREMARCVVPGGQVMVLELTTPEGRAGRALYGLYLNCLLPAVGRFFSKNPQAYRYLAESIMDFPPPGEFSSVMEASGLAGVERVSLTFGVAHLHIGIVPVGAMTKSSL